MKIKYANMTAPIIALFVSAFVKVPAFTVGYFFALNVNGLPIATQTKPVLTSVDPFSCQGGVNYCSGQFTAYQTVVNGGIKSYYAAGYQLVTYYKGN